VVGAASEAASGAHKYSSAIGKRCPLCGDATHHARTYQTSTSGVMVGSAGKAAEGVCAASKVAEGVWEHKPFTAAGLMTSYSSIPVYIKGTLGEKGQARDTRVHVTLQCF